MAIRKQHPITSDALAIWRFNTATGNVPDLSGNGNTAVEFGTVPAQAGQFGISRGTFSQTNYFRADDSPSLRPDVFTFSAWVYWSSSSQRSFAKPAGKDNLENTIKDGPYQFNDTGTGLVIDMAYGDGNVTAPRAFLTTGRVPVGWHHIGVTLDASGNITTYFNGVLVDTSAIPDGNTVFHDTAGVWFGRDANAAGGPPPSGVDQSFNGRLEEVALYGEAKSPCWFADIAGTNAFFKETMGFDNKPTSAADPLILYQFDGTAQSLNDRTLSGFDLSVQAGTLGSYIQDSNLTGLNFDQDCRLFSPSDPGFQITGAITYEVLLRYTETGRNHNVISVDNGGDESPSDNFLWSMRALSSDIHNILIECGSGFNESVDLPQIPVTTSKAIHLLVTRDADGRSHRVFVNGVNVAGYVNANAPTDGSSSDLHIGGDPNGSFQAFARMVLFGARVTQETWTDEQVEEAYLNLVSTLPECAFLPVSNCGVGLINKEDGYTLTHYECLPDQHRSVDNGGGVLSVPFSLGNRFMHIRRR